MAAHGHKETKAVVLGLSPTGLYAVRELGRAGIPVYGVSRYAQCASASRYIKTSFVGATESEILDHLMNEFRADVARPVLIPASDDDVDFIIRNHQKLSQQFAFQASYADGLAAEIMTKSSFYEMCDRHGVETSGTYSVARSDLASVAGKITFPCFVKPSRIHDVKALMKGVKGWTARTREAFTALEAAMPAGDYQLIVQEIIPGPESNISLYCAYFDQAGQPHQAFTSRKLRQYPPGFGSASLVVSDQLDETKAVSEKLLKSIGYQGIAATEFKRDPRDNRLKIIEINPRPSLWFSASTASGRLVTLAAYNDLARTGAMPPENPQKAGVCWRYGAKDLYSKWFYRLNGNFLLPPPDISMSRECTVHVDAVACSDDPRPDWAEKRNWASKLVTRALGQGGKAQRV